MEDLREAKKTVKNDEALQLEVIKQPVILWLKQNLDYLYW